MLCAGCESERQVSIPDATRDSMKGVRAAEANVSQSPPTTRDSHSSERPAATLIGQRIEWGQIEPLLGEAAGSTVMEEVAIDLLARRELENRGLTITKADIDAEESLLTGALERAGARGPRASELIMQMRAARGLGPLRYRALLERNAMLRRLVLEECEPTPEQLALGMQVRFGPRIVSRIIVTPTQQEVGAIHARLTASSPESREMLFAAEAFRSSIDPSKERGGLLEPISPADASYASAVRSAIEGLAPGQVSPIVGLDNGYAIFLGVSRIEAVTPPADGEEKVRQEIRTRLERVAMDQLARRLVQASPPTIFDSSMNWSWESRQQRQGQ